MLYPGLGQKALGGHPRSASSGAPVRRQWWEVDIRCGKAEQAFIFYVRQPFRAVFLDRKSLLEYIQPIAPRDFPPKTPLASRVLPGLLDRKN